MIPKAYITEWKATAPWGQNVWIEQDLVISRALVEMFRVEEIAERLAFRGGTALYKLYLHPSARYSEDIDLVQMRAGPIGDTLDLIRSVLDPWLGTPAWKRKAGRVNLVYRFESEDAPHIRMRLKIEINSREHFSVMGTRRIPFNVDNSWFTGGADVTTFELSELLGTKLRALYQRKKGRDLFDLWFALERGVVDVDALLTCFDRYMAEGGHSASRAQFEANLAKKANDRSFRGDIAPLLRPGVQWNFETAAALVHDRLVQRLPGVPWKGASRPRERKHGDISAAAAEEAILRKAEELRAQGLSEDEVERALDPLRSFYLQPEAEETSPPHDDWRRQGQEQYLRRVGLKLQTYTLYREGWDHDHCEFCSRTFSTDEADLNVGYATHDRYRWICETCFEDFRHEFEFVVL